MGRMKEYAFDLSEALGHGGEFNDQVENVYTAGCAASSDPDTLLELVKVIVANAKLTDAAIEAVVLEAARAQYLNGEADLESYTGDYNEAGLVERFIARGGKAATDGSERADDDMRRIQ